MTLQRREGGGGRQSGKRCLLFPGSHLPTSSTYQETILSGVPANLTLNLNGGTRGSMRFPTSQPKGSRAYTKQTGRNTNRLRRGRRAYQRRNTMLKRFEGVEQGLLILPDVVAAPGFPQGKGAEAVIGELSVSVRDDVLDGFTRTQLDAGAMQLPGDDSRGCVFLVGFRRARQALADDEFFHVHASVSQLVKVTVEDPAGFFELAAVTFKIACLGQDLQDLLLHVCNDGRCIMPPALKPANLEFAAFRHGKKAVWHRDLGILPRGKKDRIAIDGFNRQRQMCDALDLLRQPFVIFAHSALARDVK